MRFNKVFGCILIFALTGVMLSNHPAEAKGKIALNKTMVSMFGGDKVTLTLKNLNKKQRKKITWKSSKTKVAKVNKKGVVTAIRQGDAKVYATYKRKKYTCKIRVTDKADPKVSDIVYLAGDRDVRCHYSDAYFKGDFTIYDKEIAAVSLALANVSGGVIADENSLKKTPQKRMLDSFGFKDFDVNHDYRETPTEESAGVACAKKNISVNNTETTLIVVIPRSNDYGAEWASNMNMGDGLTIKNHEGFEKARDKIISYIKEYITTHSVKGNIRLWFAGQSRGAAISNLSAGWFATHTGEMPEQVKLTKDDIVAYCFATPMAAYTGLAPDTLDLTSDYMFIHNISFIRDLVHLIPPEEFGFGTYGYEVTGIQDLSKEKKMMSYLKLIDPKILKQYEKVRNAVLEGMTAEEWVNSRVDALVHLVHDRATYAKEWQKTFIDVMLYLFGNVDATIDFGDEKIQALLNIILEKGLDCAELLFVDHYPQIEYAWLLTSA